jgi:hypothetical protein
MRGCKRQVLAKGLCRSCYAKQRYKRADVRLKHLASSATRRQDPRYRSDNIARCQRWTAKHPGRLRERTYARLFGITIADYDARLRAQGGGCAICGKTKADGSGKRLAVDHDHATGAFRGLLCSSCNIGLGRFKDDPARLSAAISYLRAGPHV